jgi:hypothetical protein
MPRTGLLAISVALWSLVLPGSGLLAQEKPPGDPGEVASLRLNHVYVVLDHDLYTSLARSKEMTDLFGLFEETMETGEGDSWTAMPWVGRRAYVEIFDAAGQEGREPGYGAIALSVHRPGDLARVEQAISSAFPDSTIRKTVSGSQIPWFDYVKVEHERPAPMNMWVMEFSREHLERRGIYPEGGGSFTREAYWDSIREGAPYEGILDDIVGLELGLTGSELTETRAFLLALGFAEDETNGEYTWTRGGLEILARQRTAPRSRIEVIRFSLAKSYPEDHSLSIGDTRLRLGKDGFGTWELAPNGSRR